MDASYYNFTNNDLKEYDLCVWCYDGCIKGEQFCEDCQITGVPELMQQIKDLTEENKRLKSQLEKYKEKNIKRKVEES